MSVCTFLLLSSPRGQEKAEEAVQVRQCREEWDHALADKGKDMLYKGRPRRQLLHFSPPGTCCLCSAERLGYLWRGMSYQECVKKCAEIMEGIVQI